MLIARALCLGSKMVFLHFRQRLHSIQGLVAQTPTTISKQMVKWTGSIADESIVLVEGIAQAPLEPVKSATVSDVEILVSKVRDISFIRKLVDH